MSAHQKLSSSPASAAEVCQAADKRRLSVTHGRACFAQPADFTLTENTIYDSSPKNSAGKRGARDSVRLADSRQSPLKLQLRDPSYGCAGKGKGARKQWTMSKREPAAHLHQLDVLFKLWLFSHHDVKAHRSVLLSVSFKTTAGADVMPGWSKMWKLHEFWVKVNSSPLFRFSKVKKLKANRPPTLSTLLQI